MHLSLLLDMAADAMGDRRAVTAPEGELTFAELRDAAVTAAGVLGEPGGRTVQLGVNSLPSRSPLLAASQAGTAFTPLNYRLADADLRRIAERAAPAVAIVDDDMVSRLDGVEGLDDHHAERAARGGDGRRGRDDPGDRGRARHAVHVGHDRRAQGGACCATATSRRT